MTKQLPRNACKSNQLQKKIDFYFYIYGQVLTSVKEIDHIVVENAEHAVHERDYNKRRKQEYRKRAGTVVRSKKQINRLRFLKR